MKNIPIILASKSLRRQELIKLLDLDFEIKESTIKEDFNINTTIEKAVIEVALKKAKHVFVENKIIIGADTIVVLNNKIYGKPKNKEEAFSILKDLSGKVHQVITGVAFLYNQKEFTFYEKTNLEMYQLSDEDIINYINRDESYDKAGAYGIQGYGSLLIKGIEGDYFNVMGFPVALVNRNLKTFINEL